MCRHSTIFIFNYIHMFVHEMFAFYFLNICKPQIHIRHQISLSRQYVCNHDVILKMYVHSKNKASNLHPFLNKCL